MRPVQFAHFSAKAVTMHVFIWQKDLFSVACYVCACMKLHATLIEKLDLINPAGVTHGVITIYLFGT